MILNTTNKPLFTFSAMQRLATHGETVVTRQTKTIDDFYGFYEQYENVASKVIVDDTDFVLANDICNAVTCPVVTLDIEHVIDNGTWEFREYNPDEE